MNKSNPPAEVRLTEGLGAGAEARCSYPACHCPLDDPGTPGWCAKGLPRPFLFAGQEHGAWFVWRQERAHDTMAQRVAGHFGEREEAEALLGPLLAQLEAPNVAGNRLAEGKSELTGLLGGPARSEKE